MAQFLYLTNNKPSRKASRQFTTWLKDNFPECTFVEINVDRTSHPMRNRGRYQGCVEGPPAWEGGHAEQREAVFTAARRLLAE